MLSTNTFRWPLPLRLGGHGVAAYPKPVSQKNCCNHCAYVKVCTCTYAEKREARAGERMVPGCDRGAVAGGDGINFAAEESLHSKALPPLRDGRGAPELCPLWPQGEAAIRHLRAGRTCARGGTSRPQWPTSSRTRRRGWPKIHAGAEVRPAISAEEQGLKGGIIRGLQRAER